MYTIKLRNYSPLIFSAVHIACALIHRWLTILFIFTNTSYIIIDEVFCMCFVCLLWRNTKKANFGTNRHLS